MKGKYIAILTIFLLIFLNANVISLSDRNYNIFNDPPDIRIAPDDLEIEWPEYGLPPIPPNTPPDIYGIYKKSVLEKDTNLKTDEGDLPEGIKILKWQGDYGSFQDYQKHRKFSDFNAKIIKGSTGLQDNALIVIFINEDLEVSMTGEIAIYDTTLNDNGYSTAIITISGGDAQDLKDQILNYWNSGYNVVGAVLIGSLPVAWYYHEWDFHGPDLFPCDLFLMDLDGNWVDSDNDGNYDIHNDGSGDTSPEIYVGRIDASDFGSDEVQVTKDYFQKIQDYWDGNINHTDYGLTYTEMDWNTSNDIRFAMGYAYDTYEPVYYPYVERNDYVNIRLPDSTYEFIQLACHSWSGGHAFTDGGSATSDDIRNAPPMALFYNLFCCGALRFTDDNCLGNAYILDTSSPSLSVVGSTKSGSMLNFRDFYDPLGRCSSFGEAFKIWFEDQYPYSDDPDGYNEVSWYYGMIILGDPTLIPQITPSDYYAHDIISVYNDGDSDLIISDIITYYNPYEPTGWLDVNPRSFTVKPVNPRYVTISVDPENLTSGSYHSWLHIYSNDPDENPYNVSVNLKVIGNDIAITSINYPIGNQLPGEYQVNATVKNCGTQTINNIGINCSIFKTSLAESFESYPYVPPYNWITVNNGWSDSLFGAPRSGTHWAYAWGGDYDPDCWLITKQITLPTDADLSFWYRIEASQYPAAFKVAISTSDDPSDIYQYDVLWDSGMYNHDDYILQIIDLSSYSGQEVYIGFHHYDSTNNMYGILIDDVSIHPCEQLFDFDLSIDSLVPYQSQFIEFEAFDLLTDADYIINVSLQQDDERMYNNIQETYVQIGNRRPMAPQISGETNGKAGVIYDYDFMSTDPDSHNVKYYIDWGDGNTEWTDFSSSGDIITVSHNWEEQGSYVISSKAVDELGLEGPESTLEVSMPVNQMNEMTFLQKISSRFPNAFPILQHILSLIF